MLLMTALLHPGCATAFIRSDTSTGAVLVYPATTFDAQCLWECGIKGEHPLAMADSGAKSPPVVRTALGVGSLIDLPFSLVSDTVLLPVDLYRLGSQSEAVAGSDAAR